MHWSFYSIHHPYVLNIIVSVIGQEFNINQNCVLPPTLKSPTDVFTLHKTDSP